MTNRYSHLEHHADAGLGAEEFEQTRRFTRRTEKSPAHPTKDTAEDSTNTNPQQED